MKKIVSKVATALTVLMMLVPSMSVFAQEEVTIDVLRLLVQKM